MVSYKLIIYWLNLTLFFSNRIIGVKGVEYMSFWIVIIIVYVIFISIYTSKKEDGHYLKKNLKYNKKISYMRAWMLNFLCFP